MLKQYIKEKYNKPGNVFLGAAHRIDRPVSGVVLFARTSKALKRLSKMFREQVVKKIYWAIVKSKPPEEAATITHYLVRDTNKNKTFSYSEERKNSKKAVMSYKIIDASDNYYLLEIDLQTGRHHQIRSQLSKLGCPVRGDLKYGYPRSNDNGGISLHSRSIEFHHPVTGKLIKIVAEPPGDKLWKVFKNRNE